MSNPMKASRAKQIADSNGEAIATLQRTTFLQELLEFIEKRSQAGKYYLELSTGYGRAFPDDMSFDNRWWVVSELEELGYQVRIPRFLWVGPYCWTFGWVSWRKAK